MRLTEAIMVVDGLDVSSGLSSEELILKEALIPVARDVDTRSNRWHEGILAW